MTTFLQLGVIIVIMVTIIIIIIVIIIIIIIIIINIIAFFTLGSIRLRTADVSPRSSPISEEKRLPFAGYGSIYSAKASGASASLKQITQMNTTRL